MYNVYKVHSDLGRLYGKKMSGERSLSCIMIWHGYNYQMGKTKTVMRTVVRETGVYRHHGDPIESHMEPLGPSQHYRIKRFKGGHQMGSHYAERCYLIKIIGRA